MRKKAKSALAILLSVAILVPTTPTMVFAESIADGNSVAVEQTTQATTEVKEESVGANDTGSQNEGENEEVTTPAENEEVANNTQEENKEEATEENPEELMSATGMLGVEGNPDWAPTANDLTYNGSSQLLISGIKNSGGIPTKGTIRYCYKLGDGDWKYDYTSIGTDVKESIVATNAGTYTVYYKSQKKDSNWNTNWSDTGEQGSITVTIKRANPSPTVTGRTGLVCDDTDQALLDNPASNNDEQTLQFSVKKDNGDWSAYSTTAPTGNAGGTYYIRWKLDQSTNYNSANNESSPITVVIKEGGVISDADVTLSKTSYTWEAISIGDRKYEPTITVKVDGRTLTPIKHYTVSGTTSASIAGEYTVTITGTGTAEGGYTGTVTKTWTVGKHIQDASLSLVQDSFEYTGYEKEAKVLTALDIIEKSGDVTATDAGKYTMTVSGKRSNGYYGSRNFSWEITPRAMSDCAIDNTNTLVYNGKEQTANFQVWLVTVDGTKAVSSDNYTITGNKGTNAGTTYVATFTANSGNFTGTTTKSWTIEKKTASAKVVKNPNLQPYTGQAQELVSTSDVSEGCTVEYVWGDTVVELIAKAASESNWSTSIPTRTNAGTYEVAYRIKGTNDYKDVSFDSSNYVEVTINPATPQVTVTPKTNLVYTGSAQSLLDASQCSTTGTGTIWYNIDADNDGDWDNLIWTTDASDIKATNAGTYKIGYQVTKKIGDDNYKAVDEKTTTATITPRNISECTIGIPNKTANGNVQAAEVTVSYNGKNLTYGSDYSVSGAGTSGKDPGEYTVTVTGMNNFTGTANKNWHIVVFSAAVTGDALVYNGETQKASITVTGAGGATLTENVDYTISGNTAKDAGTHTATITGISGTLTGLELEVNWSISKKNVTASWTGTGKGTDAAIIYDGEQHRPVLTLTGIVDSDKSKVTIQEAVGWELESAIVAPAYAGTYTMRSYVTFALGFNQDNYNFQGMKGTLTHYYDTEMKITQKTVQVEWDKKTLTYNGSAQAPEATLTGYIESDNVLFGPYCKCTVSGKQTNVGTGYTATAELSWLTTLSDNYKLDESTATTTFSIVAKSLADSSVSAKQTSASQVYNGKEQTVILDVSDSETGKALVLGTDYEFVAGTQSTGTNAGEYTVSIQGKGNYTGTIENIKWTIKKDTIVASLSKYNFEYDKTDKSEAAAAALKVKGIVNDNPVLDTDYYIDWEESDKGSVEPNNVLNKYKLVIKGKGTNYEGTCTLYYNVIPRDLDKAIITLDKETFEYDGQEHSPVVTLKDTLAGVEAELAADDYEISEETKGTRANCEGFTWYQIKITGKGHYKGVVYKYWVITSTDLEDCDVEMEEYTYDGNLHAPKINSVKINGVALPETNYSLDGNTPHDDAGTYDAKVKNENPTIVGPIKYVDVTGDKQVTWKINPKDVSPDKNLADLEITGLDDQIYTGEAIEPEITIKDTKIGTLRAGIDYEVSYENNTNENEIGEGGKAVVKIKFKGNYCYNDGDEYLEKEFTIKYGQTHTVKYYANADDENTFAVQEDIPHMTTTTAPETQPEREGYEFAGWAILNGESIGEVFVFDNPITCDYKLVAKWVDNTKKSNVDIKTESEDIDAESTVKQTDIPLTTEEEQAVENGKKLSVQLNIVKADEQEITEDKAAIDNVLRKKDNIGVYLDMSIIKYVSDADGTNKEESGKVTETIKPISITVTIPEDLRVEGRKYSIVRVHNGVAVVLAKDLTPNDDWEITFSSNRFSTYALTYVEKTTKAKETAKKESSPKTGDEAPLEQMVTIFTLAMLGAWVVLRIKKREYADCIENEQE